MPITREAATEALAGVLHPELGRPLAELGMLRDVTVSDAGAVSITVMLGSPLSALHASLSAEIERVLASQGAAAVDVRWDRGVLGRDITSEDPTPGVKNVVLVMSGKGGVGKSTVAANLAVAFARAGAEVGLLDADMYGPSIPTMFGVHERPTSDGQSIDPVVRFGVKLMSIGLLLDDPTAAVVWRGPMLHGALLQFIQDVRWGTLDYLIVDLPPGTGDVAITLSQRIRGAGAVIVTTPQEVALQDVYKAVSMCQKVGIGVLGVIENESFFICDGCGKRHELFGRGGGETIARFSSAPLLAQVPIDPELRASGDSGTPIVQAAPDSPASRALGEAAARLADRISAENVTRLGPLRNGGAGAAGPRHLPIAR